MGISGNSDDSSTGLVPESKNAILLDVVKNTPLKWKVFDKWRISSAG